MNYFNYFIILVLLLVPANLEAKQRSDIFEASNYLSASGVNSRITSQNTDEYLDFSTDDYAEFQGAGGSDNTDLRIDLDGTMPVLDSPTDSLIGFLDGVQLGQAGIDGQLVFYNELGATDYTVTMNLSGSQGANITYTLPPTDGAADEFLKTDGSGVLTWVAVSGVTASSGDVTAVGDCTSGACFGSGGSGNTLTLNSDYVEFDGTEDFKLDTSVSNTITGSSDSGVTKIILPWSIELQNGETIDNATNNSITLTGSEDLIIGLGTSNKVAMSSSTGASELTWGAVSMDSGTDSTPLLVTKTFSGVGVTSTASNTSTGSITGFSSTVSKTGTDDTPATGLNLAITHGAASGTNSLARGIYISATKSGAGTLTEYNAIKIDAPSVSAGTLTRSISARLGMAMNIQPQASVPGGATSGDLYVDSTPNPDELCFYDGSSWQGISSGTDANCA